MHDKVIIWIICDDLAARNVPNCRYLLVVLKGSVASMKYEIYGKWRKGYAFDLHTVASTYLGPDELGHDRFDNRRTEMGELVYRLNYKNDKAAVRKIIKMLGAVKGIDKFDAIIPAPSSKKSPSISAR